MANGEESYTQRLSREIDAAYEAYRPGEPEADTRLYEAFREQARNVIWQRLTLRVEPLEHDISSRAIIALKQFRGESRLSTWFYALAQNEVTEALSHRIEDRERLVPLDAGKDENEKPEIQLEAKPTNQDAALDLDKLQRDLPPAQAEVLGLSREGFSLEEIAQKTGRPVGTIRSQYRLAKAKAGRLTKKSQAR